ncbi:hypothetical protein D9M68_881070 [compost metagenome]
MRRALHQPETLALVAGYSFGDAHLNELIFDAAMRRERTEIIVFCYATIPDALAERALITPNIQVVSDQEAIIGGVRADWAPPEIESPGLFQDNRFLLGDFRKLAEYLAKSSSRESANGHRLQELLEAVVRNNNSGEGE